MQHKEHVMPLDVGQGAKATASRSVQIFAALMFGMSMLYVAGFMQSSAVHNAAHDMRHTIGFPCH